MTPEQFDALPDGTDSLRDKAMVALLFDSGLRLSELASIRSEEIDWSNNTLRVVAKGGAWFSRLIIHSLFFFLAKPNQTRHPLVRCSDIHLDVEGGFG